MVKRERDEFDRHIIHVYEILKQKTMRRKTSNFYHKKKKIENDSCRHPEKVKDRVVHTNLLQKPRDSSEVGPSANGATAIEEM